MEKNRLAEALKKYELLVEYNFYVPKGVDEQEAPPADAPPAGGEVEIPAPTEPIGAPAPGEPMPDAPEAAPIPEPQPEPEGEVEIDITDLVNSSKDTKEKIEGTNELLNNLLSKFEEFESKMSSFDQIINRIDNLEQDIDKRLPTPIEKLEMRSMDSYPYSVKLTDFWKDEVEGIENSQGKEDDYTLTDDDVKKDYSPSDIKNSFDIQKPEDQDFRN